MSVIPLRRADGSPATPTTGHFRRVRTGILCHVTPLPFSLQFEQCPLSQSASRNLERDRALRRRCRRATRRADPLRRQAHRWRTEGQRRLESPRGARRHVRQSPRRLARALESAIDWIVAQMKKDGLDNVHTEPVMVPHWVRGRESATLLAPHRAPLHMLGLGRSVGTPAGGITAQVLVVNDFADLHAHAAQAKGKIVLFDHHFDTTKTPFDAYGDAVIYRGRGADSAAAYGARRCARALGDAAFVEHAAHGRDGLRRHDRQGAQHSDGGDHARGCGHAASHSESRSGDSRDAADGGAHAPRCALAQHHRRGARHGASGRGHRAGRAHRLVGRRTGRDGRRGRRRGRVGGRAADQAARAQAQAHDPRGGDG